MAYGLEMHSRRKFILTCPASSSDIQGMIHVLITNPLQNVISAFLPIFYPSQISRRFLRHVLGVGSVLFSVSNDFRRSSRCIQRMFFRGEDRRTPQEVHLQLSPQEPPEQHLQSPQGPIFRILGVE
jgi:hypothetical protein